MVREDKVLAAHVQVDGVAQILSRHDGAFEVPARASFAPGAVPFHGAVRRHPLFPEREVAYAFLVILVALYSGANFQLPFLQVRELAVGLVFLDGKVDAAVLALVSDALVHQDLDKFEHLLYVVGGPRRHFRGLDAQGLAVLKEALGVPFREGPQLRPLFPRVADGLVVHVGDVHDVLDLVTP